MTNVDPIKVRGTNPKSLKIGLPMRNSVKIFIGLSMPALALVAVCLWRLSKWQKKQENTKSDDEQNNRVDMSLDGEEKTLLVEAVDTPDDLMSQDVSESVVNPEDTSVSPAESVSSDQKKEASSDSETSLQNAPECECGDEETWEIEFPQALCGRLIGKKGKNVQKISQITGTKIRLIPQKDNMESTQRLVALTGTEQHIHLALRTLQKKFPSVPFTRLNGTVQPRVSPVQDCLLNTVVLPQHQMFHVYITNIVDANHFYVQLYDQMSVQAQLQQLDENMYHCYGTPGQGMADASIPHSVTTGMVCTTQNPTGWWWRTQVVGLLMKPDEVEITWLDYGGKATVSTANLRQLRQDFMQLPFQAVECYLSNVVPHQGESSFSMTACALFEGLAQNTVLTARITSYVRECPSLELYAPQWTGQPIFINRELVRRGCLRWLET